MVCTITSDANPEGKLKTNGVINPIINQGGRSSDISVEIGILV